MSYDKVERDLFINNTQQEEALCHNFCYDTIPECLHDHLLFGSHQVHDDDDDEKPLLRIGVRLRHLAKISELDMLTLLRYMIFLEKNGQDAFRICSLELYEPSAAWLLPTFLTLLPRLQRMDLKNPQLHPSCESENEFWCRVCMLLEGMDKLSIITVTWTTLPVDPDFLPDDAWLKALLRLPLKEYHHEGQSRIACQRWTRLHVMKLLFYHKTIEVVRIDCPLIGAWPERAECFTWKKANRYNTLRLMLPSLSHEDRQELQSRLPHYVVLLPEGPIVSPFKDGSEDSFADMQVDEGACWSQGRGKCEDSSKTDSTEDHSMGSL